VRRALAAAVALVAAVTSARAEPGAAAEVRVGVVVGADQGARGRPRLRYAEADAERFATTLISLGGFEEAAVRLLLQPRRAEFLAAVGEAEARIAAARRGGARRALLLLYWSGHAGDGGLELAGEVVSFAEVRRLLDRSGADVRLAFVDACTSGSLTTAKGATARSTGFELTVSASPSPDGTAIVASAAPGETALESAELRGSFFSHHLTAGLHGAADQDGDGRVTLLEAYRYAYGRTVAQSAIAAGLAQHPTYALELQGKGDLVLTEPGRADGFLVFPVGGDGASRWIVVAQGSPQVFEVRAGEDRPVRLGLAAGAYRLVRAEEKEVLVGAFRVEPGRTLAADGVELSRTPGLLAFTKGGARASAVQRLELSVEGGARSPVLSGGPFAPAASAALVAALGDNLALGARLTYSQSIQRDTGLRFTLRTATFDGGAGWVFRPRGTAGLEVTLGPVVGVGAAWQRLDGGEGATALLLRAGLEASATLPLSRRLFLVARCTGTGTRYSLNDAPALRLGLDAGLGLGWELWP